ncbi:MAG: hypothetical protein ACK5NN_06165 [Sphingomonadaceae bacterium]
MFSYVRSGVQKKKSTFGSHLALAFALAGVTTLGLGVLEAPAHAAKKAKAGKSNYSKGFVAVYQPVAGKANAEGADFASIKGELPSVMAAVQTEDDRFAAGQLAYNVGTKSKDSALQRQGMDMMLESGKVAPEQLGQFLFVAGQLAFQAKDYPAARDRIEKALAAGYTDNGPEALIAESYIAEDNITAGLNYLSAAIAKYKAEGRPIPESWPKRGLAVAYKAGNGDEARRFAALLIQQDPSSDSWGDAVAIERSFFNYDDQATLDLMRLARRTGSMRNERDYVDYISAADARRLPGEVTVVLQEGINGGKLNNGDVFVSEAMSVSKGRLAADKADLPALAKDARSASSKAVTAMAAGDAFLSYGDAAQAEEMYTIALTKPCVDSDRALTRLGIAQVDLGKYDDAKATFAKVQGSRGQIAQLWALYANQEAGG